MKIEVSNFIEDLAHSRQRRLTIGRLSLPWPFPICYGTYGSSAMVLGIPVFGEDRKFIKAIHRVFRHCHDVKWWFLYRLHPGHRYHMINTGLGYGYHERDEQLLHAAMACLIGYVEDCEHSGCHDPGDRARQILHWWRVQRPADKAQYEQWMDELYAGKGSQLRFEKVEGQPIYNVIMPPESDDDAAKRKALWNLEDKMHKDEQKYLHMLVNIRPGMWT